MTTDGRVLIEVKNLTKKFDDNLVLDGISTEIHQGEVVAIIGPSGSGKIHISAFAESSGGAYRRNDSV